MITQVRPRDLKSWFSPVSDDSKPLVLDVREPSELRTASITAGDYELVAIPMGSVPQRLAELDPARPIACLCHHGGRSMQVATFLAARGFTQVANIAGGIDAWTQELEPAIPRY
ncbi:MAG: sulfurtransferase [Rhodoferax sp.]|nr:sulfurtransferase [Rhodoferax sp.]